MLEPVFRFLAETWESAKPYVVINQYDEAVVLRFGNHHRTLRGGFHLKLPFFDEVQSLTVILNFVLLDEQTLTTVDGHDVTVAGVVSYRIHDIEKALLKIQDVTDAVVDACYGCMANKVMASELQDLATEDFFAGVLHDCHDQMYQYGVSVDNVSTKDLCKASALRLLGM